MSDDPEPIPSNLDHLSLRRIADALEALVELKRQELSGEIRPHYARPKAASVWRACRAEVLRLLDEYPFIDWERARGNSAFRDPGGGNIYRPIQWRRFLEQHALPNKPDDGSGVLLVALDEADKDGPSVIARQDALHCAKDAWKASGKGRKWLSDRRAYGWRPDPANCHFCARESGTHPSTPSMQSPEK